jgi:hypothetical protein
MYQLLGGHGAVAVASQFALRAPLRSNYCVRKAAAVQVGRVELDGPLNRQCSATALRGGCVLARPFVNRPLLPMSGRASKGTSRRSHKMTTSNRACTRCAKRSLETDRLARSPRLGGLNLDRRPDVRP